MNGFKKIGIIKPLLNVIEEQGMTKPTEIQEKSIPYVLAGKNVIAGSATGSGKTLAFGSGIIQNTEAGQGIQSLILTPTRELAIQVSKALELFSKNMPLQIACVYGGVGIDPQIQKLRTSDAVVGTPGRILDHINRGTINLSKVKILVLDEADRMLDMGFIDDVEKIILNCPKERQTLLFSATITYDVARLAKRYMKKHVKVFAEALIDPRKLEQVYYDVQENKKLSLLVHLLKDNGSGLSMVFCNTRRSTDFVANNLRINGIRSIAIHGGFSQSKREKSLENFHASDGSVLVCTDVAARGLDIKNITHVYNYDISSDSKDYIHRIGRTARAGKHGKVINILSQRDWDNFRRVTYGDEFDIIKVQIPSVNRAKIGWRGEKRRFNRTMNRRSRNRF